MKTKNLMNKNIKYWNELKWLKCKKTRLCPYIIKWSVRWKHENEKVYWIVIFKYSNQVSQYTSHEIKTTSLWESLLRPVPCPLLDWTSLSSILSNSFVSLFVYPLPHMLHLPTQTYSLAWYVCFLILGLAQQRNVASPTLVGEAH